MNYVLLLVGFVLLIKGADFFVDGASYVAGKFKIPPMVIGMTIVAIGTSLPEITISVLASYNGSNGMAVGNIIGSDILNTCVVLGVVAVLCNVPVSKNTLRVDLPFLLLCELTLLYVGYDGVLSLSDGVALLLLFLSFTIYMICSAKGNKGGEENTAEVKELKVWQVILYLLGGGVAIKFGGDFVVDSATEIAKSFGMSDNLIGLTIIALGTSLPELVTSIVAARKKQVDLALGNVVGSNVFNIILALMAASIVSPIMFTIENIIDLLILMVMSIFLCIFAKTDKTISRAEGILFILSYCAYMGYAFVR